MRVLMLVSAIAGALVVAPHPGGAVVMNSHGQFDGGRRTLQSLPLVVDTIESRPGGVLFPLSGFPSSATSSGIDGRSFTPDPVNLTAGDIARYAKELNEEGAGNTYLNLATPPSSGGQLRAQVQSVPEPAPLFLLGVGLAALTLVRLRRR